MQVSLDDYPWAAGVVTDLVNTAPGVWNGLDHLADPLALAEFLADHVVAAYGPGPADLTAVRTLRDRVRSLIDDPEPELLVRGASELTGSVGAMTLAVDGAGRTRWQVVVDPDAPVAEQLATVCGIGVLGVVHNLGSDRFRPCGAPTCSGVFIDTSRPGRRRYCMPGLCGNRVNVANHRARRQRGH